MMTIIEIVKPIRLFFIVKEEMIVVIEVKNETTSWIMDKF